VLVGIFLLVEFIIDQKEHRHLYKKKDTLNNILIGLGLFSVSFLNRAINYPIFYLVHSIRVFSFENTVFTCIAAFIVWDFSFYWAHRAMHGVNWLWASHSVHHSSEHYNLSLSLRQSWVQNLSGGFLFKAWMPLIGFDPLVVALVDILGMAYQSWLHSEMIRKLHPWFEFLFNTPSHHRVHHASDIQYLDKNHGGVFIVWDRIFGTYQDEVEKPSYGLTNKLSSQHVSNIMWSSWRQLFTKAFSSGSLKVFFTYFLQSPGWSHDGSSKTVKQMRKHPSKDKKNHDCKNCGNLNCPMRSVPTAA
jgi:sterol desaturase/sphingolipid hydroxylase (fatty acid hydroxylase superfamily)